MILSCRIKELLFAGVMATSALPVFAQTPAAVDVSLTTPAGHEVNGSVGGYTYVEPGDQRISIPPRHGGDRDIPRGTAQNILRRLKEILQVPLKLVAGEITEVRELAVHQ